MTVSVANQAYVFLCSVIGGIAAAFIYDLFRIKRKAIRTINLITHLEDLIYWIIVSLMIFLMVYISNDGQLRGFIFLGIAIGVLLYILLLSRLVMKVSLAVISFVAGVISTVVRIILFPLILLCRLLIYPLQLLSGMLKIILGEIFKALIFKLKKKRKNKNVKTVKARNKKLKKPPKIDRITI